MQLPSRGTRIGIAALVGIALAATPLVAAPASAADPLKINLLNINDFHGRIDSNTVQFAATVQKLKKAAANGGEANTLFLSAGDNIGASVYASASQQDKPTLDVLNALGLKTSAVGNHEFDQGASDLTGRVSDVANWDFLGANVYTKGTTTVAPGIKEYATFDVPVPGGDPITVGVIGAITQETPSLVSPAGISGLDFGDPVDAVNRVAAQLTDGNAGNGEADVLVAEYHEGAGFGAPDGATLQQEINAGGAFAKIVTQTSASVDAIFTGHTHKQYAWDGPIPGVSGKTRPILQTGSYGEFIGQIVLTVDSVTGDVSSYAQSNVARPAGSSALDTTAIATDGGPSSPVGQVAAITKDALDKAAVTGNVKVGTVTADITTAYLGAARDDRASESALGNLVADSLVSALSPAARGGATIGIVNPGGLRAELLKGDDGVITYAEANAVLPFANGLFTEDITGAQFKTVLEQQWQTNANGTVPSRDYLQLGLSKNVSYTYDPNAARGSHITSIFIDGKPIDVTKTYRIGTFSFLTSGGDNFRELAKGTNLKDSTLIDRDAWISYITASSPLSPSFARRAVATGSFPTGVIPQGVSGQVALAKLDLTSLGSPKNTSVSATFEGSKAKAVVSPVIDGAATAKFTVPFDTPANATLILTANPSGTVVRVPITTSLAIDANVPKITGDNKVGSTLKATVGTWDPRPVSMTYRWYADGKAIKGATTKSLKLTKALKGKTITFRAVGKKAGLPTAIRYSKAVKVYLALKSTPRPTVYGTARVGSTLKVLAHKWTPSKVTLSYQWYRDGVKIPGATKKSYKLVAADKGAKKVTIKVTGKKKGYLSESQTRSVTKIK